VVCWFWFRYCGVATGCTSSRCAYSNNTKAASSMIRCWVYIVRVPTCSKLIVLFKTQREYLVKDGAGKIPLLAGSAGSSVCGIATPLAYWRFNSSLLAPRQSQETKKINDCFLFYDARLGLSYSMYIKSTSFHHQFRGLESWMCVRCVQRVRWVEWVDSIRFHTNTKNNDATATPKHMKKSSPTGCSTKHT
jgi:hypothetical protein